MSELHNPMHIKTDELNTQDTYTLVDHLILRNDSGLRTSCSAFDIRTDKKYKLNNTTFAILRFLDGKFLTSEQIIDRLRRRDIDLPREELSRFIKHLLTNKCLKKGVAYGPNETKEMRPPATLPHEESVDPEEPRASFEIPVASTPFEIEIHPTNACNLRCRHCAYSAGSKLPEQLSADQWLAVVDQLEELKVHKLIISGGEPLLLPGMNAVLRRLATKRLRVYLLTNGILIQDAMIDFLSQPNFSTTVSLDGPNMETHDLLRGQGSFEKTMTGLALLSNAKANFQLAATIHKKNRDQLKDLTRIAVDLGAKSIAFMLIDAVGRAAPERALLLDLQDIRDICSEIEELRREYASETIVEYLDPLKPNYKNLDTTNMGSRIFCAGGTTRLAIRSDGMVFPCVYAFNDNKFAMGSVIRQSLKAIWLSENWQLFRGDVKFTDLHQCRDCHLSKSCTLMLCRLRASYTTGDFFGRPPGCHEAMASAKKGGDNDDIHESSLRGGGR